MSSNSSKQHTQLTTPTEQSSVDSRSTVTQKESSVTAAHQTATAETETKHDETDEQAAVNPENQQPAKGKQTNPNTSEMSNKDRPGNEGDSIEKMSAEAKPKSLCPYGNSNNDNSKNQASGGRKLKQTSSSTKEISKRDKIKEERERSLQKTIDEKRKNYACGSAFSTLENIPTWPEYFELNRREMLQPADGKEKKKSNKKKKKKKNKSGADNLEFPSDEELNNKVSLWRGDITALEIDCIVNAANNSLLGGGGVDGAIHDAAGYKLYDECESLHGCNTGEVKDTAGYDLPAKYVLHTVGPVGELEKQLRSCYEKCLQKMLDLEQKTIAFPCISTGVYGYPNENAAYVAIHVLRTWLSNLKSQHALDKVDRVVFCLFMQVDVNCYRSLMQRFFPLQSAAQTDDSASVSNQKQAGVKDEQPIESKTDAEKPKHEKVKRSEKDKTKMKDPNCKEDGHDVSQDGKHKLDETRVLESEPSKQPKDEPPQDSNLCQNTDQMTQMQTSDSKSPVADVKSDNSKQASKDNPETALSKEEKSKKSTMPDDPCQKKDPSKVKTDPEEETKHNTTPTEKTAATDGAAGAADDKVIGDDDKDKKASSTSAKKQHSSRL